MIAIIGAMNEEVKAITDRMSEVKEEVINNVTFYRGLMSGKEVVVMLSGIGKVKAAISTCNLFTHYDVEAVVNIGTAGGLSDQQKTLDVVVSTAVAPHDFDGPGNSGIFTKGMDQNPLAFSADSKLIELVTKIIDVNDRVFVGEIVSGDMFIYKNEQVEKITREFPNALCAEMEAASVGEVCTHYNKPFVVIRSLSDVAVVEGSEMHFDEYVVLASERSAIWCQKFVEEYKNTTL